jgi:hypothetical protein
MRTSDAIDALAAALALAQADIRPALKDANNPAFNSKYADLSAVFDAVRPALAKHGLSVVQMPEHSDDALLHLTTRVCHKSGQWIEGTMSIPVSKVNAHGYGSAITYARRYALSAALGVVADEDDDGNKASETASPAARIAASNSTARATADEAFNDLPPEAQAVVREWAMEVIAHVEGGRPDLAVAFATEKCEVAEDKLALWSQLPANIRAAFKKAERAAA